jgi:hypothetical protein
LKSKEFSLAVGNLVKCRTEDEFVALRFMYEGEFAPVMGFCPEHPRGKLLLRTLKKAGLIDGEGKEITVEDEARWEAVFMWRRVVMRMPSTTNCLEVTHKHLNEAISRRNPFWDSLALLFEAIADKTIRFETAAVHDFRISLKRSRRKSQSVSQRRRAEKCAFLGSTAEVCSCTETVHVSSSYQADIPCSHRYAMGAVKPVCPGRRLNIRASTETVAYSEMIHQRDRQDRRQAGVKSLKDYVIRQIARFLHTKDKAAVLTYVDAGFDVTGP